jgi:hypothetical protein
MVRWDASPHTIFSLKNKSVDTNPRFNVIFHLVYCFCIQRPHGIKTWILKVLAWINHTACNTGAVEAAELWEKFNVPLYGLLPENGLAPARRDSSAASIYLAAATAQLMRRYQLPSTYQRVHGAVRTTAYATVLEEVLAHNAPQTRHGRSVTT